MTVLENVNLAVRFLLELALLAAVGTATWQAVSGSAQRVAAVTAVLLTVSAAWALLVHGAGVPAWGRVATQVAALCLGVLALVHLDAPRLAAAVGLIAVVNAALLAVWHQ